MPMLELTELEAKVAWLLLDKADYSKLPDRECRKAAGSLFGKVYRVYRGMPPEKAA